MWSALISNELNFYRIAAGQRGYKSSAPWYREHQQPSGAPRRNTQDPPLAQKAVDETRLLVENQMTDGMRRTRHVALPVRAWRYVGLLIVSLACLTLGLVSRDKEGRAGSLAGPELEHRAPHEVDACPNLGPFTEMMPSCTNLEQGGTTMVLKSTDDTRSFRTRLVRMDNGMPRSRNLDRLSRARVQPRRDYRSAERLARQGTIGIIDSSRRASESRLRARDQDRAARHLSSDPAVYRLSRSLNLDDARSLDRRSRSTESRPEPVVATDRRENRENLGRETTSTERRESSSRLDDRFDVRDRRSRSVERREATSDRRRAARGDRVNGRSLERRVNERRDSIREDRREVRREVRREDRPSLPNRVVSRSRMDRRVEDRRSPVRAVRDSRLNTEEAARSNLRSVVDERRSSRYAAASRDQDRRSVRSMENEARQMDSRSSRSSERTTVVSRAGRQASRSTLDRENSRVSDDPDRKSAKRSTDMERRRGSSRLRSRAREASRERESLARSRTWVARSTDSRRERSHDDDDDTLRNIDRQNRAQLTTRRDSRLDLDRRSSARLERREVRSERSERMNRLLDRRLDARSIERRDSSLARSLERTRSDSLERRERTTSRLNLAREARESRIRLARASEDSERQLEQRRVRDLSGDRRSERRALVVDSRRSSDGRSTVSMSSNREQVRADRRQTEQRIDRRDLDSRRSIRQRLVDASRSQRTRATARPANGVGRLSGEQRLTDRIHLLPLALPRSKSLNDVGRSRVVDPDLARLSDSAARLLSSRVVPSANARLFASRAKIPGVAAGGILNQEQDSIKDGLTLKVIRQAIVIGLCAVYGLSTFQGKRSSFISNVVRQAPRFVVW